MSNPTVLIADDVEEIRSLLKSYLSVENCDVVAEAEDGTQALEMINQLNPNIVFLDINMPGISGLDLLDKISANDSIFPVIVSGESDFETIKNALAKGSKGFIVKPLSDKKISQIIDKYRSTR